MCGIVGYTGKNDAVKVLLGGLYALEYRGYDSAGIAVGSDGNGGTRVIKCGGRVSELDALVEKSGAAGHYGIGHTRWATHGAPVTVNAHPHSSGSLTLVHNGIIDNCVGLGSELAAEGYVFSSETDTEVIAHLLDREYKKTGEPAGAIFSAEKYLSGSYALAVMFSDRPGEIWACRKESPLIVALGEDGNYLASDIPALLGHSRDVFRPEENTVVRLTPSEVAVFRDDGSVLIPETEHIEWESGAAEKDGFPHFMLKEIHEQPGAVRRCAAHRINGAGLPDLSADGIDDEFLGDIDCISVISCGSATHAGLIGRCLIEAFSGIPVTVNAASEYRYRPPATVGRALVLAVSQSGETADTLAALRLAKRMGHKSAAIVNVFGSAIASEADRVMYTNAGPEIAVATTKGYTTQVAVFALLALKLGLLRGKLGEEEARKYCRALVEGVPEAIKSILSRRGEIAELAKKLYEKNDLYFIGRGPDGHAGAECSLKLKEISYVHSESYAAGELKHGTLSLICDGTPVIALATEPEFYDKMVGNVREVRTRGGYVLLVCGGDLPDREAYCDDSFVLPGISGAEGVSDIIVVSDASAASDVSDVSGEEKISGAAGATDGSGVSYTSGVSEVPSLFSPLVSVPFCQLLSYEVAVLRGCDVDHPRNLAKSVTVE